MSSVAQAPQRLSKASGPARTLARTATATLCERLLRPLDSHLRQKHAGYLAHFEHVVGYSPNLAVPRRYHEKMLWRRLFDHSPHMVTCCDKLATKEYVRLRCPEIAMPETLWSGENLMEIPRDLLSRRIAIKCNHGCNYNYFWVPGESELEHADALTRQWMSSTYGGSNLEWAYTRARRTIFAEAMVETSFPYGLLDISVRCADGTPILASVISGNKTADQRCTYFDLEGNRLDHEAATADPDAMGVMPGSFRVPETFFGAIDAARRLSEGLDYARYDFLADDKQLYAGEITVYPSAGLSRAVDDESGVDCTIDRHWDLLKSWFLSNPQRGWLKLYASLLRGALR